MTYAIQFKHLSCKIANKTILHNINLEVETGSIVGILGPNGAGKSTLLSLVLGLRKQSSGELSVLQNSMPANASRIRPNLGVVLQETALYDELSTVENLRFAASLYNLPKPDARINEVLSLLMLSDRANQLVRTLSGGMRRRVAIARALIHAPQLLVIDEPTLGVDVEARHAIWSHLRLLKSKGHTTLVATNYLDEAQALCDKVAVLREGQLLAFESPDLLVSRAGHCLDVECPESAAKNLIELLNSHKKGIMRIDEIPGGLSVFLEKDAVSQDIMQVLVQSSQASGFRLRAPDLIEVFKSLEFKA